MKFRQQHRFKKKKPGTQINQKKSENTPPIYTPMTALQKTPLLSLTDDDSILSESPRLFAPPPIPVLFEEEIPDEASNITSFSPQQPVNEDLEEEENSVELELQLPPPNYDELPPPDFTTNLPPPNIDPLPIWERSGSDSNSTSTLSTSPPHGAIENENENSNENDNDNEDEDFHDEEFEQIVSSSLHQEEGVWEF